MMKINRLYWVLLVFIVILLSGCAHTRDVSECLPQTEVSGFWSGFWHGAILPFSFIGHLFDSSIALWDANNNGNWYFFGFILGSGSLGSWVRAFGKVIQED